MGMVLQNPEGSTTQFVDYDLEILILEEEIMVERAKNNEARRELERNEDETRRKQELHNQLLESNRIMSTWLRTRDKH